MFSGHNRLAIERIINDMSNVDDLCCFTTEVIKPRIAFFVLDRNGRAAFDTDFEEYNQAVVKKLLNLQRSQPTFYNSNLLRFFKNKLQGASTATVKVRALPEHGLSVQGLETTASCGLLRTRINLEASRC